MTVKQTSLLTEQIHDPLPELQELYTDIRAHPALSMQEARAMAGGARAWLPA